MCFSMAKLLKNEDGSFEINNLEITLKKSLWEKISGFFWGTLKLFLFLAIIGMIAAPFATDEEFSGKILSEKTYTDSYFREEARNENALHIGVVKISGAITDTQTPAFSEDVSSSKRIIAQLLNVIEDEEIDAVLIQINSPGGEVLATEKIATVIDILREKSDKKIYVLLDGMAASGGYYIATSGEKIFAYPETLLGNIGVRIDLPKVKDLMGKIGIEMQTIASGEMKTMGSPFRDMTEEEQKIFQELVDESYTKFVNRVAKGRDMTFDEAKILADGRIYSGNQAKENGLVDTLISSFPALATEISLDMKQSEKEVQFVSFDPEISPFDKLLMGVRGEISGMKATLATSATPQFVAQ